MRPAPRTPLRAPARLLTVPALRAPARLLTIPALRAPARLLTIPALLALTILTLLAGPLSPVRPAPPATPAADAFPAVVPASGPQTTGHHRAPVPDLASSASLTAPLEAREGGEAAPGSHPADDSRAVPLADEPWAGVRPARAAVGHEGHGERPAPPGPLTGAVPVTAPLQPGSGRAEGPEGDSSSWSDQAATDHGRAPPATARA
ncbi:hypothetical protein ACFYVM_28290 [Streptomyces sp. NPDC003280]|uniref:hypothetical protein n=1 Tax=Streptomyces sp. NPDC003280 TaxID=3364680 RepID=UPI0036938D16